MRELNSVTGCIAFEILLATQIWWLESPNLPPTLLNIPVKLPIEGRINVPHKVK